MVDPTEVPLLGHPLAEESAFTAKGLVASVRAMRGMAEAAVPPLCVLEFDGDLTDWLVAEGKARRSRSWPCFHTAMYEMEVEGVRCGIIPRTIGGPYAVLIAEQLAECGVEWIVGLTSAGRVGPELPLPCLVVAGAAVRDEGTSLHYLPGGETVQCNSPLGELKEELRKTGWEVREGTVWTTDAPYRETETQLRQWAKKGVLAVEMQAASLFAFGEAKSVRVACVAMVSNAVDHAGEQFDTGTQTDGLRMVEAMARAFGRWDAPDL
ncbi:MAG: nucleoside phosphorylase [Bryobacterales bacterium]|nr:nucleoside phosphorylase [Bryobacterales bacterium]